jgi:hypothetical protein
LKKKKLEPQEKKPQLPVPRDPQDLDEFIREAEEVRALTATKGWQILCRDLGIFRDGILKRLAYINPKSPSYDEARILYIATDKIFSMIEDYQENKDKAIELLNKIENPDLAIAMDVDTE